MGVLTMCSLIIVIASARESSIRLDEVGVRKWKWWFLLRYPHQKYLVVLCALYSLLPSFETRKKSLPRLWKGWRPRGSDIADKPLMTQQPPCLTKTYSKRQFQRAAQCLRGNNINCHGNQPISLHKGRGDQTADGRRNIPWSNRGSDDIYQVNLWAWLVKNLFSLSWSFACWPFFFISAKLLISISPS